MLVEEAHWLPAWRMEMFDRLRYHACSSRVLYVCDDGVIEYQRFQRFEMSTHWHGGVLVKWGSVLCLSCT